MVKYIRAAEDMSYSEFKKTYSYAVKQWPDVTAMFGSDHYAITLTTENYIKKGSQWKLTDSSTEEVTFFNYMNAIDAVPFFKGLGGSEKVTKSYTAAGLIPVEISSINPDRTEKTVRKYRIEYV